MIVFPGVFKLRYLTLMTKLACGSRPGRCGRPQEQWFLPLVRVLIPTFWGLLMFDMT